MILNQDRKTGTDDSLMESLQILKGNLNDINDYINGGNSPKMLHSFKICRYGTVRECSTQMNCSDTLTVLS